MIVQVRNHGYGILWKNGVQRVGSMIIVPRLRITFSLSNFQKYYWKCYNRTHRQDLTTDVRVNLDCLHFFSNEGQHKKVGKKAATTTISILYFGMKGFHMKVKKVSAPMRFESTRMNKE